MQNDFLFNLDVDQNHFNEIYPGLLENGHNQYYNIDTFNDAYGVSGVCDLNVIHLNIRSMNRNGDTFLTYLSCLKRSFDVICLSETFVNDVSMVDNFLEGYVGYHSIREGESSRGGVAIFIKKCFNSRLLSHLTINLDYVETVFIEISYKNKKTTIGCCYRRPNSDKDLFLNYCNENFSLFFIG